MMSSLQTSNLQTDSVALPVRPSVFLNDGLGSSQSYEAEMLRKRLHTFQNYKGKKTALQLAMAGFVYTGTTDKVMCNSCGIRLFNWIGEEDPLEEHRKHSADCSFIRTKFSSTNSDTACVTSDSASSSRLESVPTLSSPKYRNYITYEERLKSFAGWPLKLPSQKPNILALSGFFYIGSADRARCFHCGLTLRDWDDDDFPPAVHKEWSVDCEFAKHLDVEEIRRGVENEGLVSTPTASQNGLDKADSAVNINITAYVKSDDSVVSQASQDNSKSNYGYNPTIQAVLEMGYSIEVINKAIEKRKREVGSDFPNAVALFEAVLEQED